MQDADVVYLPTSDVGRATFKRTILLTEDEWLRCQPLTGNEPQRRHESSATDFIFYNYEIWLKDNPAPDLQDWGRRYGGYPNIPWPQLDAAMQDWEPRRITHCDRPWSERDTAVNAGRSGASSESRGRAAAPLTPASACGPAPRRHA
jgi:hypothetical protein